MSGLRTPARLLPRKRRAAGPQYARWQGSTRFLLLPAVCTHPTQPSSPKCPLCKNFRCCPQLLQLATFSARSRGGEAPEPRFRACQTIRLPFHTKPPTDSPSVRFSPTHPPSPASEPTVRERSNVTLHRRRTVREPVARRCVSSWRDAGSPYGGSDCSPNVSNQRIGSRGAPGAYAAGVTRVTDTLDCRVRLAFFFCSQSAHIRLNPPARSVLSARTSEVALGCYNSRPSRLDPAEAKRQNLDSAHVRQSVFRFSPSQRLIPLLSDFPHSSALTCFQANGPRTVERQGCPDRRPAARQVRKQLA
jgi:hypothetical protein